MRVYKLFYELVPNVGNLATFPFEKHTQKYWKQVADMSQLINWHLFMDKTVPKSAVLSHKKVILLKKPFKVHPLNFPSLFSAKPERFADFRDQIDLLYSLGVNPVSSLNILLKADLELKPHSKAIPNIEK